LAFGAGLLNWGNSRGTAVMVRFRPGAGKMRVRKRNYTVKKRERLGRVVGRFKVGDVKTLTKEEGSRSA